jgi:hypothetical protein
MMTRSWMSVQGLGCAETLTAMPRLEQVVPIVRHESEFMLRQQVPSLVENCIFYILLM